MSGTNPFRRRPPPESAPTAASEYDDLAYSSKSEFTIPPIETGKSLTLQDIPRSTRAKTVKTVRIISPHSADSEPEEHLPDSSPEITSKALFSPPPERTPSPNTGPGRSEDPFGGDSEEADSSPEDAVTLQNTIQNIGTSGSRTQNPLPFGAPLNPFKKTLATIEQTVTQDQTTSAPTGPSQENNALGRPHYDVDGFKKLLLTGEDNAPKSTPSRAPTINFGQPIGGDAASSTDTSSVSRQSLFEPPSSILTESPRTSRDASPSTEERQNLVSPPSKPEKVKPSTPRHRYGKSVKTNAPQTVSFEDPSLSFGGPRERIESTQSENWVVEDKPLPTLPSSQEETPVKSTEMATNATDTRSGAVIAESNVPYAKKVPPAPPSSRKKGQSRPTSFVQIPELQGTASDMADREQTPTSPSSSFITPSAPPPPPPRRSGPFRVESSSSVPTLASVASSSEQSIGEDLSRNPLKPRPPVPSARSPIVSATKTGYHSSPQSGSPGRVPPAPPPRRRGSSQSSHAPAVRLSGDYRSMVTERLRSDSGASSISHLAMTPLESTPVKQDVMADLTTLQKEVDELRGKIGE